MNESTNDTENKRQDKIVLGNLETIKHIHQVRQYLYTFIQELDERAKKHDASKLEEPEASKLAEFNDALAKTKYADENGNVTEEYEKLLEDVKPALEHHYAKNRHHPQHWPDGVNDMTLIDLVEMLCDWKAATQRNKSGNIRRSVEANAKRFGMSEQLTRIFENTVREMFEE